MVKKEEVKVTVENLQDILVGNYGANLSLGLEFAKEAGIEDKAIEIILANIAESQESSILCDLSILSEVLASNNEKAIDNLIDYGNLDYKERCLLVFFFSETGTSALNLKQKKDLKSLAEILLEESECHNRDTSQDAEHALKILKVIGDFDSLNSFYETEPGACFNINKYECDGAENNYFTVIEELCEVISKILLREKDKSKVIDYIESFLEESLITTKEDMFRIDLVKSEYPSFITFLSLKASILYNLKTDDQDINLAIKRVAEAIGTSLLKHPEPTDFDYEGYVGFWGDWEDPEWRTRLPELLNKLKSR